MLTYEQLKEKETLYRTSEKAADAIYSALWNAETDDICATYFEGSPKLPKITTLKEAAKEIRDNLRGAHLVLMNLRLETPYEEIPARDYKMSRSYWKLYFKKHALTKAATPTLDIELEEKAS